jgi:ferredoxin-NADP reductase
MILGSGGPAQNAFESYALIHGARTEELLAYRENFTKNETLQYFPCVSREKTGVPGLFHGRVGDQLRSLAGGWRMSETFFLICGSNPMVDDLKLILTQQYLIPEKQIRFEGFGEAIKVAA